MYLVQLDIETQMSAEELKETLDTILGDHFENSHRFEKMSLIGGIVVVDDTATPNQGTKT